LDRRDYLFQALFYARKALKRNFYFIGVQGEILMGKRVSDTVGFITLPHPGT
jgi:hypothetical protein